MRHSKNNLDLTFQDIPTSRIDTLLTFPFARPQTPKNPLLSRGRHRKHHSGTRRVVFAAATLGLLGLGVAIRTEPPATNHHHFHIAANVKDDQSVMTPVGQPHDIQLVSIKTDNQAVHDDELAHGVAFAQERENNEKRLNRPMYVTPVWGMLTSTFGYRWGAMHAGIDIANHMGSPIYAVADGTVIDSGWTNSGFGAWVKIRHTDGTVTLYGHINTWTVSVGQHVLAGDQIATIGNRGYSTGPHCHFSVIQNGSYINPIPWLHSHGIYTY